MIDFGQITGTIRLALLFFGLGAPAFSGCLSESELAQWSARDKVPGIYDMVHTEVINLTARGPLPTERRSRNLLSFDERTRQVRFWMDDDVLVATFEGRSADRHLVVERVDFPAEDLRSFDFADELQFTEDDRAAEATLLSGCPFERLPRLVGRADHVVERATRESQVTDRLWLVDLGEIGMIGAYEHRLTTGERRPIRMMSWTPVTLVPQQH